MDGGREQRGVWEGSGVMSSFWKDDNEDEEAD